MNKLQIFRWLSRIEGLSYLLLLLIAMPLKYLLGLPLAVRIVGGVHGALFILLLLSAADISIRRMLSYVDVLKVFGWSLVPLGFLMAERVFRAATSARPSSPEPR